MEDLRGHGKLEAGTWETKDWECLLQGNECAIEPQPVLYGTSVTLDGKE
jgi:hypothetical protein